eukprot:CAMPEP_0119011922 /NCGR_PEP_ID=MMETSP1176-20130426/5970_1 /TAXON_ID=265551 /ORGANISM="Synedropsis recta cf, Strain CCMP1620" /LENGTH=352 /DNA_ID=CAMNT_0006964803 /DNA_START=63 /DNA_END=1118 /DNA_ORIENTATION=-
MTTIQQPRRLIRVGTIALLMVGLAVVSDVVTTTTKTSSTEEPQQQHRRRLLRRLFQVQEDGSSSSSTMSYDSTNTQQRRRRPIIHTFYNPLLEDAFVTEMDDAGDAALVEAWKEAWWEAGFEPRVLTLEDAKSHVDFIPLDYAMSHTWLDGYNKMCIWRWVAMSNQIDGGWMVDYDVFPLGTAPLDLISMNTLELPNNGILTVHDRFIPDMVSGSSEEWIRVAKLIVEGLLDKDAEKKVEARAYPPKKKKRRTYTRWTDMFALQQWWAEAQMNGAGAIRVFESDSRVMARAFDQDSEGLGVPWTPEKCQHRTPSPSIVAVHFSHDAIKSGIAKNLLHEGQTMNDRAAIAKEF